MCDLLSTIEVKDERKIAAVQIKNIASDKAASLSGRNESVRILRKKKFNTGILHSNKSPKKAPWHHGVQRYYVLCKKAVIPERKYMSHSSKDLTGVHTNRSIKDVIGGPVGSMADYAKQYKNSEKWNNYLKDLKK